MGIGLDYVTFPSMVPLRGKNVSKTTKKERSSHIKHFPLFSSKSQPLIFLKCLCLSGS